MRAAPWAGLPRRSRDRRSSDPSQHAPPPAARPQDELAQNQQTRSAPRRRLPAWLLPTLAALVVGVLAGALLFGGGGGGGGDTGTARAVAAEGWSPTSGAAPSQAGRTAITTRSGAEPVQVDVPATGVSSSLVDLGLNGDGTLEVLVDFLEACWFTGGSLPGAVLTVTSVEQHPKNAFPADRVCVPVADSELVLITCTSSFDQTVRSYRDNLVGRATRDLDRSLAESNARAADGTPVPSGDQPNV